MERLLARTDGSQARIHLLVRESSSEKLEKILQERWLASYPRSLLPPRA
ncbi:MAG: hypothetical protein ACYC91_09185 [Solirubrobacteraceae bacterium]